MVSRETFLKIILSVVCIFSLLFTMCSCGVSYTDEEVIQAVSELVPMSEELNEIYFGEGLPIADEREDVERYYSMFEVDVDSVNYHPVSGECKFQSEEDIKTATEKVFSEQYCAYLYELAFSGISSVFYENTEEQFTQTASYARYIQTGDVLTVRIDLPYEAMELGREYDFSKIEIIKKKKNYAVVTVPTIKNGESLTVELKLIYTPDGFRLDTPTY